jgi:hypothetical protein
MLQDLLIRLSDLRAGWIDVDLDPAVDVPSDLQGRYSFDVVARK